MLIVNSNIRIPRSEFRLAFARSSGPGGQNVNKVSSKVQLRWSPERSGSLPDDVRQRLLARVGRRLTANGELLIVSQRYRDQARNIDDCLEKLRLLLVEAARPPKRRRPTRPTRASRESRLRAKQARARTKQGRRAPGDES